MYVIKNHPFVDGNKRMGLMAAILFLASNKRYVHLKPGDLYTLGIKIAASTITINKIAQTLKDRSPAQQKSTIDY